MTQETIHQAQQKAFNAASLMPEGFPPAIQKEIDLQVAMGASSREAIKALRLAGERYLAILEARK